jgi:hypothetical protein
MTTATVKKSASKYTAQHIAAMTAAAPLNLEKCAALAATDLFKKAGITARGIGAKALNEGIAYERKERADKTGQPVADKAELAEKIGAVLGVEKVESLAKADKSTLRAVLAAVVKLRAEDEMEADEPAF